MYMTVYILTIWGETNLHIFFVGDEKGGIYIFYFISFQFTTWKSYWKTHLYFSIFQDSGNPVWCNKAVGVYTMITINSD